MWMSPDPPEEDLDDIPPNTVLSQYGTTWFKTCPHDHWALSLCIGPLTVHQITKRVTGRAATSRDHVRHTTVEQLRDAGFLVFHRYLGSRRHLCT